MWERIERFVKNLLSAVGRCFLEEPDTLGGVIVVAVCVGVFWLIGVAVYEIIVDPHITTAATLDALSIDPDKWLPR